MPNYRVSFSVWRMGSQSMFSYLETDKDYATSYTLSYPITHQEAVELSSWATNRSRHHRADALFDAFGWSVYIDSLDVINPNTNYRSYYTLDRSDPDCFKDYRELVHGLHRVVDHSV